MIQHGKDKNEIDRDFSDITESNEVLRTCFRCGTRLMKSLIEGYTYFCPDVMNLNKERKISYDRL